MAVYRIHRRDLLGDVERVGKVTLRGGLHTVLGTHLGRNVYTHLEPVFLHTDVGTAAVALETGSDHITFLVGVAHRAEVGGVLGAARTGDGIFLDLADLLDLLLPVGVVSPLQNCIGIENAVGADDIRSIDAVTLPGQVIV